MTTPKTSTPRTDANVFVVNLDIYCDADFARQLETELNETKAYAKRQEQFLQKAYLCTCICHNDKERNEISCPVCLQKQLLTTQAECAAMREALENICNDDTLSREFVVSMIGHTLTTTAGKELLEERQTMIEALAIHKQATTAITVDRDKLRTRQEELIGIAEELANDATVMHVTKCPCQRCKARAKLTAFKEKNKLTSAHS